MSISGINQPTSVNPQTTIPKPPVQGAQPNHALPSAAANNAPADATTTAPTNTHTNVPTQTNVSMNFDRMGSQQQTTSHTTTPPPRNYSSTHESPETYKPSKESRNNGHNNNGRENSNNGSNQSGKEQSPRESYTPNTTNHSSPSATTTHPPRQNGHSQNFGDEPNYPTSEEFEPITFESQAYNFENLEEAATQPTAPSRPSRPSPSRNYSPATYQDPAEPTTPGREPRVSRVPRVPTRPTSPEPSTSETKPEPSRATRKPTVSRPSLTNRRPVRKPAEEKAPAIERPVRKPAEEKAPAIERPVRKPAEEKAPAIERPVRKPIEEKAPAIERPARKPIEEKAPAIERPVRKPVIEQKPAAEKTPVRKPVIEQKPTVEKRPAGKSVIEQKPAVSKKIISSTNEITVKPSKKEAISTGKIIKKNLSDTVLLSGSHFSEAFVANQQESQESQARSSSTEYNLLTPLQAATKIVNSKTLLEEEMHSLDQEALTPSERQEKEMNVHLFKQRIAFYQSVLQNFSA